jgi:hypothetical protein
MGIVDGHILIAPVNVRAELAPILGRSTGDVGQLCGDVRWDSSLSTPAWVSAGGINPMAKYKAVRHSNPGILSATERASARYGFATPVPTLNLTHNVPQNNWVYQPPRGMNGGGTGVHEWYRVLDFVKSISETQTGYDKNACSPLVLSVGQLVYDAQSQILLYGEGYGNGIREDGLSWVADHSLSLSELLSSNSDYYGYYISFLLIDISDNTYPKNLIVTNTTVSSFVTSSYNYKEFDIYAEQTTESGLVHPAVPLLESSRRGHDFTIIACILPGNQPSGNYAYAVYTESTSPAVATLTPYSLGFVSGCDRITRKLDSGAFTMDGMAITSVPVTCRDTTIERTFNNMVWRAYQVEVRAILDTSQVYYSGTEKTVSGTLALSNGSSFIFGSAPDDSSGSSQLSLPTAVSLVGGQAGQNKMLFTTGEDKYLWVWKEYPSSVTVTAALTLDYPLNTPISKSGTATITP